MLKYANLVMEKLVNILICIIFIAILFCLYNLFCLKILHKNYVNIFGYSIFEVATGSMGDSIKEKDAVIVKIDEAYSVGDVVTYQNGDDFITHRVMEDNGDYIITKGDANNTSDNPIDKGLVLGKVVHVFRSVGIWKEVLLTPKVLILIFVTLFMFSMLFSYNGKKIKISMIRDVENNKTDPVEERYNKRRTRQTKKLEYTQIMKPIEPQEDVKSIINDKKKLEYTQVINSKEINKKVKQKKSLDYTQVIDLNEIKSGDKRV